MSRVFDLLDITKLGSTVISIITALLCITIHELAHGLVALKLGDTTARDRGRLTLNPIKHIDPVGFLMMVIFGFGWAKPVPVDMRNLRNPKRDMALVALAGPVSNMLLAVVFAILGGVALAIPVTNYTFHSTILDVVFRVMSMSIGLAVFNLIPLPPLDGSKILFSVLPDKAYARLMVIERYGSIILMVLLFSNVLDGVLATVNTWVMTVLLWLMRLILVLLT